MISITVFTPTYNRAALLEQAYQSLKAQTNQNFTWLIVDDGSMDGTKALVNEWILENSIKIDYYWKENGGMHTAHNMALELTTTTLVFCLDSDDDLEPQAIERILANWDKLASKDRIIGMAMHEKFRNSGKRIGSGFPPSVQETTFKDLYYKYNVTGDKLLIYKSSEMKKFPYPVFENERFVALDYKYLSLQGYLALVDESPYRKEYLEHGHSRTIISVYAKNPLGFAFYHDFRIKTVANFYLRLKSAIHLSACMLLADRHGIIRQSPHKLLSIITLPFGLIWFLRLKREKKALGL